MLWDHGFLCPKVFTLNTILDHHAQARLDLYGKRRVYEMAQLEQTIVQLTDEYRFVCAVIADPSFIFRKPKQQVEATLTEQGFRLVQGSYNYLLRLPLASVTTELLEKLAHDRQQAEAQLTAYTTRTIWDMWETDLENVALAYTEFCDTRLYRRANPDALAAPPVAAPSRKRVRASNPAKPSKKPKK